MTENELILKLLDEKYIIKLGENEYAITNKLKRDFDDFNKSSVPKEEKSEKIALSSPSQLLKQFIKDCKIPFRAKTSSGIFYQLSAESEYARKYLYNVMANSQYNYDDMVKVTNVYFNNDKMARVTLTNYFKQGIFDQLMEEFMANPKSITLSSGAIKVNRISL